MSNYFHDFSEWADVANNFAGTKYDPESDQAKALAQIPEPEEVLYAGYTYEDYNGDAVVIFRNGDQYFMNEGGHCSCYGLEGQWDPTEAMDRVTLLELLLTYRENSNSYCRDLKAEAAKHVLDEMGIDPLRKSKRSQELAS